MTEAESIEVATPRAPVPLTDPHVLKGRMLEDYTRKKGTYGLPVEATDIERLVMHDLTLAAGYKRDELVRPAPSAPDPGEAARRRHAAEAEAAAAALARTGNEIEHTAPRDLGPVLDLPPDVRDSDQWRHARGRLRRISMGASQPIKHPDGSFDFKSMTATCEYPAGAHDFLSHWFAMDLRYVWQTRKSNPFYGLSLRDASLKFVRLMTDICDRSTGVLGGWWTPK